MQLNSHFSIILIIRNMTYMGENLVLLFLIISKRWVIENHLRNTKTAPK